MDTKEFVVTTWVTKKMWERSIKKAVQTDALMQDLDKLPTEEVKKRLDDRDRGRKILSSALTMAGDALLREIPSSLGDKNGIFIEVRVGRMKEVKDDYSVKIVPFKDWSEGMTT